MDHPYDILTDRQANPSELEALAIAAGVGAVAYNVGDWINHYTREHVVRRARGMASGIAMGGFVAGLVIFAMVGRHFYRMPPLNKIHDLARKIGAPLSLKDIGMKADALDDAARLATQNPYYNPRLIEYAATRQLLQNAWEGRRLG
jgi:glycerol dehydrogenase-like iron-containing ADH family enzyme